MSALTAISSEDRTPTVSPADLHGRMIATSQKVTYRRIRSADDFEEVGRLRRIAYDCRNIYTEKFGRNLVEDVDLHPDTYVFGVYERTNLVATLRLNRITRTHDKAPALELFGDVLKPLVEQGMTFIDPSRLAVDTMAAADLPGLHLVTLRLAHMATHHFSADYCLALIKSEHGAFYRRVFKATQLAAAREVPGHIVRPALFGGALESLPDISARYPLFRFSPIEPRLLFDSSTDVTKPLAVAPTAAMARRVA